MTAEQIRSILDQYDQTPLECDGFTLVANAKLLEAGGTHVCMEGPVAWNGDVLDFHRWMVDGDLVIDYRLRMWFGEDARHGVFRLSDHPGLAYDGTPARIPTDPRIVDFLLRPWPTEEELEGLSRE